MARRILFATDFSEPAERAYAHAVDLARRLAAELVVLHVQEREEEDLERTSLLPTEAPASLTVREIVRYAEKPGPAIAETAEAESADLVIVGTHGRTGLRRLFLGSVAERVVREASCAVLTVPEGAPAPGQGRVLAPVDFSDFAGSVVYHARAMAAFYGTGLDLLHVIQDVSVPTAYGLEPIVLTSPDIMKRLDASLRRLANEELGGLPASAASVDVVTHVETGFVGPAITQFAATHDTGVIVLASHGLTGIEHALVGSVTEKVVRTAPCAVLTVRAGTEPFI